MMTVQKAQREDVNAWLGLAAEVEHLFGPMVNEPGFMAALKRNIDRGSAFCIRESDGPAGTRLLAGLLFSAKPPVYKIEWMSVARDHRRRGLGSALLKRITAIAEPPSEIVVTTFGSDVAGGEVARAFYSDAGFVPAEMTKDGPEGKSRQVLRKKIEQGASNQAVEATSSRPRLTSDVQIAGNAATALAVSARSRWV